MKQRRTIKLWQMIVLMVLPALILITMFLPAYHIDGGAAEKICDKMTSSDKIPELAKAIIGSIDTEKVVEDANEKIADKEEEYGIELTNITPARIMTNSFQSFFGELGEEDAFSDLESVYTKQRVLLWVVYLLAAAVILILALGYWLKWTKYIPLSVSAVYGLAAAVVFGIFQFAAPYFVIKVVNVKDVLGLGVLVTNLLDYALDQFLDSSVAKIIACFWGIAFLTAFIIAALTFLASVVFLFIGNAKDSSGEDAKQNGNLWEGEYENARRSIPEGSVKNAWANEPDGQVGVGYGHNEPGAPLKNLVDEEVNYECLPEIRPEPKQPAAAKAPAQAAGSVSPLMGRVLCTKGVAAGQGFSLPEDRKVVVGKNGRNANLIIGYPGISGVHCSICYKAASNSYLVKDHSTNGTFVNGIRLQKGVGVELAAGTTLQLADGRNEITLG